MTSQASPFKVDSEAALKKALKGLTIWDKTPTEIAAVLNAVFEAHAEILDDDEPIWEVAEEEISKRYPDLDRQDEVLEEIAAKYNEALD